MKGNAKSNSLKTVLTRDELLKRAGDRSFARGENYFRRGYVHDLAAGDDGLTAQVSGTVEYYVELWVDEGDLLSACTCPLGVDDIFCKHCVAAGLTWLADPNAAKPPNVKRSAQKPVTLEEVQHFLEQQEKPTLVQWMLDRAKQDQSWNQQLVLKVAAHRPQGLDLTTFQRALQTAIALPGFLEWNEVSDYVDEIGSVLDSIQALLEDHPQAVIELSADGISLLETAMNSVDDSSGELGSLLEAFQSLHYEACKLAPPDPVDLAEQLFDNEMESGFGSFSNAVETYADILGDRGLAHYRQLAETMWSEFPALSSKDAGAWDYKRHKLQRILETLAKASGDLEAIVAIKRRDLSRPRTYQEIAQLYFQAGQADRALEWAEAGLKAFDRPDSSLRDLLFDEYHRRGRIEEAMALAWQAFTESVSFYSYQKLQTQATQVKQWPAWREKALAHIRQQLAPSPPPTVPPSRRRTARHRTVPSRSVAVMPAWNPASRLGRDHSLLVEIFLSEAQEDLAWQEAQTGGCSKQLWLKLADRRQRTHPDDALPIYQREIDYLIQQTNNPAYAEAVSLLHKVHDLRVRLNQPTDFTTLVDHLRKTYKAKRNFIALLNRQKW
jgi:uncharacterized Zn finger protein